MSSNRSSLVSIARYSSWCCCTPIVWNASWLQPLFFFLFCINLCKFFSYHGVTWQRVGVGMQCLYALVGPNCAQERTWPIIGQDVSDWIGNDNCFSIYQSICFNLLIRFVWCAVSIAASRQKTSSLVYTLNSYQMVTMMMNSCVNQDQRRNKSTPAHILSLSHTHTHTDYKHAQEGSMVFGSPLKQADSSMKMSIQKKNFYRWAVNEPKERGHAGPRIPRAAAALSLP